MVKPEQLESLNLRISEAKGAIENLAQAYLHN